MKIKKECFKFKIEDTIKTLLNNFLRVLSFKILYKEMNGSSIRILEARAIRLIYTTVKIDQ